LVRYQLVEVSVREERQKLSIKGFLTRLAKRNEGIAHREAAPSKVFLSTR
jgi:hypothetical protein